jgi:hypothetical protein
MKNRSLSSAVHAVQKKVDAERKKRKKKRKGFFLFFSKHKTKETYEAFADWDATDRVWWRRLFLDNMQSIKCVVVVSLLLLSFDFCLRCGAEH